ncbi:MAG: amidohydrolase [Myxococcales bacterium]|nr:amidohydrolase [Myxococcales bacterium]
MSLVVDADGHVLEPRNTWLDYIEPRFRDRAIRIERDANDEEVLLIDGKSLEVVRGRLAALGGIEMDPSDALTTGKHTYEDGCPKGSFDPAARLEVMDAEGIDVALLYPTIGICWEGHTQDAALAHAYTEAYNRWIVDFCSHDPKRLVPIAHINLLDGELAVAELERAHAEGCRGIYLSPDMFARARKRFDDESLDRFWAMAQEMELPVGFHVVVRDQPTTSYFDPFEADSPRFGLFNFAFLAIDVMAGFTELLSLGVLEKFPRLKISVLETGANWISAWLDRLDHKFEVMHASTTLTMKPSDYFRRQCVVSADPDESLTAEVVRHVGAEYFIWASDYPHIDASMGVVKEIRERIAPLPEDMQRLVLGDNAVRFYGL